MVDDLVSKANKALEAYMKLDQEQIDNIIKEMSLAGVDKHMYLAKLAVEETGRGVYEDKITKNLFATEYIYHSIKYEKKRLVSLIRMKKRITWRLLNPLVLLLV